MILADEVYTDEQEVYINLSTHVIEFKILISSYLCVYFPVEHVPLLFR